MKVTSITRSINIKVNTGEFGNFDVYSSMTADLDKDETAGEASAALLELLVNEVLDQKAIMDDQPLGVYRYSRLKK